MKSFIKLTIFLFLSWLFVFQEAWGAQIWNIQMKNDLQGGQVVRFLLTKAPEATPCLNESLPKGITTFKVNQADDPCRPPLMLKVTSPQKLDCPSYTRDWQQFTISGTPPNIECKDTTQTRP